MLTRVILAVREPALRRQLRQVLTQADVLLESVTGKGGLWERIARKTADVFVVEHSLIPRPDTEMIGLLRDLPETPAVVVITERDNPEKQARLLAMGCDAVLHRGLSADSFRDVLEAVLARRVEQAERALRGARDLDQPQLSDFVSESPSMQAFMQVVRRVTPSDVALLVLGETGVGKERLARAIHAEGPRADGPFVAINCGALPESLLESELFGHEKGAFTGASRARRGWFELAHRGAVFLDEIGEMPYHLQVKLLRVLQDHAVQPIGSEKTIPVDVRVMAASNRDLEADVEDGTFRRDLFYRLSVVTLTIPPLRERREDIPVLVESYIEYLQPQVGCAVEGITDGAVDALANYSWPGNVRELINVLERALLLCDGGEITLDDLPQAICEAAGGGHRAARAARREAGPGGIPDEWLERPWADVREAFTADLERAYFASLLQTTGGRVGETAERAGIRPRSLYDKMKRHGLCKEDFRP